ncbi:hypothetical protein PQR70_20585 [Paraburkholderia madseniana]|uniref:Uncharacterized protein n=1 Tax=Paraburkholderia madseniana TaxID=2599607 RepID=A0A6N6WK53_9BURK|nr:MULTISPECIES: hypothetical protein [Paraburkholderia]KAE8760214.1 hypothetical protein FSO04_08980 [Paraburkholderia madseniana]MCX4148909.1 hypothetical protein [Paraburkholderia madseniana]MDN7151846.1 hypothetical protein [Paraburkholderia sp. WS6]MDQ6410726.1 hypothetical protein [Paraburkholderia madseniana]NPT69067.1 hypothetical protein [Paraburkholderia madseniana]
MSPQYVTPPSDIPDERNAGWLIPRDSPFTEKTGNAVTDVIRAVQREIDIMGDIKAASDERTRGVKPATI